MNEVFLDYLHKAEVALSIGIAVLLLLWLFIAVRRRMKRTRRRPSGNYHDDRPSYASQNSYREDQREFCGIDVKDIKGKPAIMFLSSRNTPYPDDYMVDQVDREDAPRLTIISWMVTDLLGKELSVQHYDIPQGNPKERTAALSRALGHFQKELHDCCLQVWRYEDDEGYHVIKSEIERLGKNCILHYIPFSDLETMSEECGLAGIQCDRPNFPLVYLNIMDRQYSGKGTQDEVQAMAECFFRLRRKGRVRLIDIPEKGNRK